MDRQDLQRFLVAWERETYRTLQLLRVLPLDQFDFRPARDARSLAEVAWSLAAIEARATHALQAGRWLPEPDLPELVRPGTVAELPSAFTMVHLIAVDRVQALTDAQLAASLPFVHGVVTRADDVLHLHLLHAGIHARGMLALMHQLAGGTLPPGYMS